MDGHKSGFVLMHDISQDLETLVRQRTAELIKANNRLQLEVLERDLAEEQSVRKTKLLDAINQLLQLALGDSDEKNLAQTYLSSAKRLTSSPFGLIAEKYKGRWRLVVLQHRDPSLQNKPYSQTDIDQDLSEIWRRLSNKNMPFTVKIDNQRASWQPLAKINPNLVSLLAVALNSDPQRPGFVALADQQGAYALIDQFDVEAMSQAYMEAVSRKRMEKAKSESEKRLALALESANEGLWDYAPLTGKIYYSPRWFGVLGHRAGELPDTLETWTTLTHPEDLPMLENTFSALANREKDAFSIEVRMLARNGQWLWMQVRGRTVEFNNRGRAQRIVGTIIDISNFKQVELALQKANAELKRLAALDDLTQIANRRRLDDRLGQEWRRAQRNFSSMALIMCDIDYFKNYNDTYGHLQGDQALYDVAQAINDTLKRPMDIAARYGGEEFAMILPDTDIDGAMRVANEVMASVASLKLVHKASKVAPHITLSFGVAAMIPRTGVSPKILLETADTALYRAKNTGRNRIVSLSVDCVASTDADSLLPPAGQSHVTSW